MTVDIAKLKAGIDFMMQIQYFVSFLVGIFKSGH